MDFIIDTNEIIFAAFEPSKLPETARSVMDKGVGCVSAASLYEIGWKHRLGKLALSGAQASQLLQGSTLEALSVSAETMIAATQLAWDHRDPWDRIIAAQALRLDTPLISADTAFDDVADLMRLWT
ncbi:MAG: type II toxin-antitoxin system VapC family toxin [Pseudomonadota bacterium]